MLHPFLPSPQENVDYTEELSAFPAKSQAGRALALVVMAPTAAGMTGNDAHKTR